ncbi:MAG: hypothetical protein AAF363_20230 [Bacteroidota bacterium]
MLNQKEIEIILSLLESSSIESKEIKDDLFDHYCCHIEKYISEGLTFEQALVQANQRIAPSGLDEIQRETQILLKYNIMINTRRITYFLGFLFTTILFIGIFFKLMHFPLATIFSFVGLFGLAWIFMPILTYLKLKLNPPKRTFGLVAWIAGLASLSTFALASLFKILHLIGADVILALSFLIFTFGFLPFTFLEMYKRSVEQIKA